MIEGALEPNLMLLMSVCVQRYCLTVWEWEQVFLLFCIDMFGKQWEEKKDKQHQWDMISLFIFCFGIFERDKFEIL